MKNVHRFILVCLFFLLVASQDALAGAVVRVADILDSPVQGAHIEIKGRLLKKLNYETLLFEDGTGIIEIALNETVVFPSRLVDPAYLLLIRGEVGSGYQQVPVVIFDSVKVVSHDPGSVVYNEAQVDHSLLGSNADLSGQASCADLAASLETTDSDQVSEVLAARCFGRKVSLNGTFVRQVNYETVLFGDSTGEIEVVFADNDLRLSDEIWSHRVELKGEVAKGYRGAVIIAYSSVRKSSAEETTNLPYKTHN